MEGDYTSALRYYQWALSIRKMAIGDDDVQTADTVYNVALVHRHLKDYAASAECFEEAAEVFSKVRGESDPDVKDARIQANRMRQLSEYSSV
jgi:tetratricopeptide (TPR) repeat protein